MIGGRDHFDDLTLSRCLRIQRHEWSSSASSAPFSGCTCSVCVHVKDARVCNDALCTSMSAIQEGGPVSFTVIQKTLEPAPPPGSKHNIDRTPFLLDMFFLTLSRKIVRNRGASSYRVVMRV